MSLYRNILRQAIKLTWQTKYFWFFGLFAILLGSEGEYELLLNNYSGNNGSFLSIWDQFASTGIFSREALINLKQMMFDQTGVFIVLTVIILVTILLFAFTIWMAVISQTAIVNNTAGNWADKKENFRSGITAGLDNFWPVLGLNLINRAVIACAFLLISIPAIFLPSQMDQIPLSIIFIVLYIVLALALMMASFIIKYAIGYVVIKKEAFLTALKKGWGLFANNWLISLEMAVILFFANIAYAIGITLAVLIAAIPLFFISFMFYLLFSIIGFWIIFGISIIILICLIFWGGSVLTVFKISAWTGLFIELISKGGVSKIMRLFSGKN